MALEDPAAWGLGQNLGLGSPVGTPTSGSSCFRTDLHSPPRGITGSWRTVRETWRTADEGETAMDKLLKLKKIYIYILSLSFMCHYLGFGDIVQSEKLHQTTMTCQLILTLKAISCSVDYFLGVVNYLVGVVVFIACSMDSPNQFFVWLLRRTNQLYKGLYTRDLFRFCFAMS